MPLARRAVAAVAICSIFAVNAHADDAALRAEIDALRTEIAALKAEVRHIEGERNSADATPTKASAPASADAAPVPQSAAAANATTLWGYGEMNYNHPTARAADAQADLFMEKPFDLDELVAVVKRVIG